MYVVWYRATLSTRGESLRLEKLRFDAGESDEFTFKRAEADAAATRVSVHQLEREVVERTNALGILLGRSPKDLVDAAISVQGASLPTAATLPAALPSSVLERRPDIGAAEASLEAAAADIGVARAEMFPRISLTGLFGSISTELGDLFTKPAEAWSASAGIVQPLFEGGRLSANVARTKAVREQRKAEYSRTVQSAFREVLDALQGQTLIAGARDANAEQVSALARATELAELRYTQGDIAYLELLERPVRERSRERPDAPDVTVGLQPGSAREAVRRPRVEDPEARPLPRQQFVFTGASHRHHGRILPRISK